MGAAVDLAGAGVKIFDRDGQFDDRDVDNATEIIKQSLSGNLTADSLQKISWLRGLRAARSPLDAGPGPPSE